MTRLPFGTRSTLLAALLLCLAGCAISSRSSSWLNPDYTGGSLKKIAVFVLAQDDSIRRFAEDQVVRRLPPGTVAVAGYTLFPVAREEDKERVRARLIEDGFDGALLTRLVSVDKTQTEIPAQRISAPPTTFDTGPFSTSFSSYYGYASSSTYFPARTIETTIVLVETKVYKLPEGTLAWAGTTEAIDPGSRTELAEKIAAIVDGELVKKGLVGVPTR